VSLIAFLAKLKVCANQLFLVHFRQPSGKPVINPGQSGERIERPSGFFLQQQDLESLFFPIIIMAYP